MIHDPQGIYYGGTIAAPVMREIFENILPYLGSEAAFEKMEEKVIILIQTKQKERRGAIMDLYHLYFRC